jgi:hypothetical protein
MTVAFPGKRLIGFLEGTVHREGRSPAQVV